MFLKKMFGKSCERIVPPAPARNQGGPQRLVRGSMAPEGPHLQRLVGGILAPNSSDCSSPDGIEYSGIYPYIRGPIEHRGIYRYIWGPQAIQYRGIYLYILGPRQKNTVVYTDTFEAQATEYPKLWYDPTVHADKAKGCKGKQGRARGCKAPLWGFIIALYLI